MAWNNVLCMYYSRTGNTKTAMEEIAKALESSAPTESPSESPAQ